MLNNLENQVFIVFSIQKFKKEPYEITSFLDIKPSKTWVNGDLKTSKGTIKYKSNGWALELKKTNVFHIDKLLDEMIDILIPKKEKLNSLKNVNKTISVIVYKYKTMPSFVYNHKIISFLSDANIELEQDIYCLTSS